MFSIANKICVITTCVVLSTCGCFKLQSQSLAHWLRKWFYFCKKMRWWTSLSLLEQYPCTISCVYNVLLLTTVQDKGNPLHLAILTRVWINGINYTIRSWKLSNLEIEPKELSTSFWRIRNIRFWLTRNKCIMHVTIKTDIINKKRYNTNRLQT